MIELDLGEKVLVHDGDRYVPATIDHIFWGRMVVDVFLFGDERQIETVTLLNIIRRCELAQAWYDNRYLPSLNLKE